MKLMSLKMLIKTIFIHYGIKRFNFKKFKKPINSNWNKPKVGTGFWASPINSDYGWYDWCKDEDFKHFDDKNSIKFKLKRNSKVLIIDELEDMENLFYNNSNYFTSIDFEKCSEKYDAILLTEKGQCKTRLTHPKNLYGWDCECLLILNKNIIKFVK